MSFVETLKSGLSNLYGDFKEATFPSKTPEQKQLDQMYASGYGQRFFDAYEALKRGENIHPDDRSVLHKFGLAAVPVVVAGRKAA